MTQDRFAHVVPGPVAICDSCMSHSLKVTDLGHRGLVADGKLGR